MHVLPCEYCEIFKSTFFNRTPSVAVSVLYTMLAQADQDNIMWVIFLQKHLCALRSNIARVIFMSNFVSGIF